MKHPFKIFKKRQEQTPDQALIQAFKEKGDLQIFAVLFERYVELLYGVCLKYLKNEAEAEEMVMALFEIVADKVLHHKIDQFKNWLYVVTKNQCLQHLRKKSNIIFEQLPEASMQFVDEWHPFNQDMEILEGFLEPCLNLLPDKQRLCLELFYLNDHSYKEIAEQQGETVDKIRSYIQNGKRNLKICIEKSVATQVKDEKEI